MAVRNVVNKSARVGRRERRQVGDRLEEGSLSVSRAVHSGVLKGGKPTRRMADLLHGTWLGHPLHPVLTDLTIGAFTYGALFDVAGTVTGDRNTQRVGDQLTALGMASAVPTALAGVADFSAIDRGSVRSAGLHGLLNGAALGLYGLSLVQRRRGRRGSGVALGLAALGTNLFSAWIGGHLSYRERVGVDHAERFDDVDQWTPVLPLDELPDGGRKRVELDGKGVLLYREGHRVFAIGSVCSHAGGPLEEGEIRDCKVQCPWHDSVFDMRDGRVVHGPATSPVASFEARLQGDQVAIRSASQAGF